jgi:hypothetical protein
VGVAVGGGMTDIIQGGLFGDKKVIKSDDFDGKYKQVLSSKRWKDLKKDYIDCYGNKCGDCGISGFSRRLELHHIDYRNLGKETIDDVALLCPECHRKEDAERAQYNEIERQCKLDAKIFNAIFNKAWDTHWDNLVRERGYGDGVYHYEWIKFRHYIFCSHFEVNYWGQLPKVIDADFIRRTIYKE